MLVVDRGRTNQRFTVLFTERGLFHKLIGIERGNAYLRLRVEGPKGLDSGPFQRISLKDGDKDGCVSVVTGC